MSENGEKGRPGRAYVDISTEYLAEVLSFGEVKILGALLNTQNESTIRLLIESDKFPFNYKLPKAIATLHSRSMVIKTVIELDKKTGEEE